jgi:hypothetical protein
VLIVAAALCCSLQTRSPSSSGDSADGADDDCSPKSHSTQLINIPEMAAQVAAEQQRDKAAAAAAASAAAAAVTISEAQQQNASTDAAFDIMTGQQLGEQRSVADSAVEILGAGGPQQRRQQDGQQPLAGLNARPLGSDEYSMQGSGEVEYVEGDEEEEDLPGEGEEDPDRDLSVACQQAEENKLSFQLKFTEPEGECWGVGFGEVAVCGMEKCMLLWCEFGRLLGRMVGGVLHSCCSVSAGFFYWKCSNWLQSYGGCAAAGVSLLYCLACVLLTSRTPTAFSFMRCAGHCKTVEFTFDMREDTADCIAKEMMDDLSLSEDEAAKIAKKIKEEIGRLVRKYCDPTN